MKKKKNKVKKITIIAVFFVLGLIFFYQAFFVEKGKVAGERTKSVGARTEELKSRLGPGIEYAVNKNTGALSFMAAGEKKIPLTFEKPMSAESTVAAKYFLQEYGTYFGLSSPSEELVFAGKKSDERKMNHIAYLQAHKKVPLFGAYGIVHLKEDNSVSSAGAKFLPNVESETKPKISAKRARKEAEKYWADWGHEENPRTIDPKLFIFNKGLVEDGKEAVSRLVWLVEIFGKQKGGHEYFFIDALDGSFVYHLSGTRSLGRNVYDGESGAYALARSEGQAATGTADIDNTFDYLASAHSYFQTNFGRDGANKLGGLGDGYLNAYADTDAYVRIDNVSGNVYSCPNAWYDYYSIKLCSDMVQSEVIGHEYMHGVEYHTVLWGTYPWGLNYADESGALSEGYADIFGEMIENSVSGSCDWKIGEGSLFGVFRRLDDPNSLDIGYGPYPAKMSDSGFYCEDGDYGGVHQNSTVLGHGAYLAAVGGTFNGRTISGIGIGDMSQIFYRAMNYYFTIASTFEDAYSALNASCSDLYGAGSATCSEFQKALQAVELDQASPCEGGDTTLIVSDTPTISYSESKKAKARINLTVSGISLTKKKQAKVRFSGRKAKVERVSASGDSTVVRVSIKHKKWPRGDYSASVTYKQKVGKSWNRGTISEDNILSII